MDEKSLSHTSWNCKYHIVLVPVSYTHLDVYKRQDITSFAGLLSAPVFTVATRTRGRFKTTVIMEVSTNDR